MPSMGFRPEQMPMPMPMPGLHPMQQQTPPPLDNLLKIYLNQEGIDRRYSHIILRELKGATELTEDQLNQAANELISTTSSHSDDNTNHHQSPSHRSDYNNSNV